MKTFKVMGILNLTPDSFYDGGRYQRVDQACERVAQMVSRGADLIDIGGESTRPGAVPVSADQELARVMPIIEALGDVSFSVDTSKPLVMKEVLRHGASMINDVNALQAEGALDVVSSASCHLCLMHRQGQSVTMQHAPHYEDVVDDVITFLKTRVQACQRAGVDPQRIVLDQGIGFGKTDRHNLSLLNRLDDFVALGCPSMMAVSRKSMIGRILDQPEEQRLVGSVALAVYGYLQGVRWFRVHDVKETVDALTMVEAVRAEGTLSMAKETG